MQALVGVQELPGLGFRVQGLGFRVLVIELMSVWGFYVGLNRVYTACQWDDRASRAYTAFGGHAFVCGMVRGLAAIEAEVSLGSPKSGTVSRKSGLAGALTVRVGCWGMFQQYYVL